MLDSTGLPTELVWPDGAPGATGDGPGDKPTLTPHFPPEGKATGAAVIVCPGGGYFGVMMSYEGHEVAEWLNTLGVTSFVLEYRHGGNGYRHPAPLQDAQRALAIVRSRADEWGVDPNRIGMLGFSAGGHLASCVGTHFGPGDPGAIDPLDRVSTRPDFLILIYSVISLVEWYAEGGSLANLLGENPDEELIRSMSSELQVTAETPLTFLVHGGNDEVVPAENSVVFYLVLQKMNVPAEMHLFEKGTHGFGMKREPGPVSAWPELCAAWMEGRGLIGG